MRNSTGIDSSGRMPLVDELPEGATTEAFASFSGLAQPDDGQLSQDELAAPDEAETAIAAGQVRQLSEARRA